MKRPITDSEYQIIATDIIDDIKPIKTATKIGRSVRTIYSLRHDFFNNVDAPRVKKLKKFIDQAKSKKETAKNQAKAFNHGKPWALSDTNNLMIMFANHSTPQVIAKLLGRTTFSVLGKLHDLNLLSFDKQSMTYYTKPAPYYTV